MKCLKKHQKLLLISIILVIVTSMFFSFNKKDEYKELPKVKVKDTFKNKQFALMLEQENGEYQESAGEFPTEGYAFNESKSGCTDINGKIIDGALGYDYETYTVLVDTSKTSYCYLYYDIEPNIGYLRSKDNNSQLTKELTGGMYRYQGTDDVSNWICFGTNNQEECKNDIDKYMYRIIGINAKGELYLLKETFLKEDEVLGFVWNDEAKTSGSDIDVCPNEICPEWNEADLFQRINGTANGTKTGNGDANDGKDNDTDIFVDNEYYNYLKSGDKVNGGEEVSEWYNLIENHYWHYGDTTNTSYNGNILYDIETGATETTHYVNNEDGTVTLQKYTWTNKVLAKISLLYLHDVLYAYPGENPNSTNIQSSWIHFQKDEYNSNPSSEWLSSRWGAYNISDNNVRAWKLYNYGKLDGNDGSLNNSRGVRPVFYLSNKINLSGSGTKENPFVVGM